MGSREVEASSESEKKSSASGFSFGFSKKSAKKLTDSAIRDFSTKDVTEEPDFVLEVNKNSGISGTKVAAVKKELIIPCTGNKLKFELIKAKIENEDEEGEKVEQKVEIKEDLSKLTEEELAARELIKEAKQWEEDQDNKDHSINANLTIPLASKEVEETVDERAVFEADVATRPDVSSQDDYDSVPVVGFGMGMLRGMGFKQGEGIGGFRKLKVDCIEPVIRPKGLGLGASRPGAKKDSKSKKEGEEDLKVAKGAYVQMEQGAQKDHYGQIEGLDEENARIIVRLALGGSTVSVSENVVRLVTKKEYKQYGKVINKETYDKYKDEQIEREKEWDREKKKRSRRSSRSKSPEVVEKKKSRKRSREKSSTKRTWLRPQLRVRIIDEDYKSGKYYNNKVCVVDVVSQDSCVCKTDEGRVLDQVDPAMCETVVPKNDYGVVMIVRGQHQGQVAEILRRDKRNLVAAVQVLPDKDQVLKVDYDDICEYTGDISYLL